MVCHSSIPMGGDGGGAMEDIDNIHKKLDKEAQKDNKDNEGQS